MCCGLRTYGVYRDGCPTRSETSTAEPIAGLYEDGASQKSCSSATVPPVDGQGCVDAGWVDAVVDDDVVDGGSITQAHDTPIRRTPATHRTVLTTVSASIEERKCIPSIYDILTPC
jgi:hypothetical protein